MACFISHLIYFINGIPGLPGVPTMLTDMSLLQFLAVAECQDFMPFWCVKCQFNIYFTTVTFFAAGPYQGVLCAYESQLLCLVDLWIRAIK